MVVFLPPASQDQRFDPHGRISSPVTKDASVAIGHLVINNHVLRGTVNQSRLQSLPLAACARTRRQLPLPPSRLQALPWRLPADDGRLRFLTSGYGVRVGFRLV